MIFDISLEQCAHALLVIICFCIYRVFSVKKSSTKGSSNLPYPPTPSNPHWFLGNVLSIFDSKSKVSGDVNMLKQVMELKSKVVTIKLPIISPISRMIIVGDPEMAKHICVSKNFPKSPTYEDLKPFIGSKSMVAVGGKEWASKRKLFNPGFAPSFLRGVVTVLVDKCDRFLDFCKQDIENGISTNMHERSVIFTSDVIAQVAFGEDWGSDSKTLQISKEFLDVLGADQMNPFKQYNISFRLKVRSLKKSLDKEMIDVVNRGKARMHSTTQSGGDILSHALTQLHKSKELKKEQELKLNNEEMEDIISQLKTFYFAGHDTTASLISWAVWLVAQNPVVCEKLRAEARRELGAWAKNQQDPKEESDQTVQKTYPTYQNLQQCTYIDAICKEALRLYPPAGTARYSSDPDAEFNGYRIGQSLLYVCPYVLQRHPDLWEKPDDFIPERFLDENNDPSSGYKFQPFSRGPRDCIGKYFAIAEAKIAISAIFLNFDAVVDTENEVFSSLITTRPLNGAKVRFSPIRDSSI